MFFINLLGGVGFGSWRPNDTLRNDEYTSKTINPIATNPNITIIPMYFNSASVILSFVARAGIEPATYSY